MCSTAATWVRVDRRWIVTVSPVQPLATPDSAEPGTPQLRLVPAHEHLWRLRSVEYDDAFEVRRYECDACQDVVYR